MKKNLLLSLITISLAGALVGCGDKKESPKENSQAPQSVEPSQAASVESKEESVEASSSAEVKVMTIDEYKKAAVGDIVTVQSFVQATQSWWDEKATVYTQDVDGAVFLYNMPISEDDFARLEKGVKIQVTGTKSEYRGEIEIADITDVQILDEDVRFIANPFDVTELLGTDDLINHQNEFVSFDEMKIENSGTEEEPRAFSYKWDNSGDRGDDLYFKVSKGDAVYTFTVESYLCGKDTDVYKAVEGLKVGDVVDLEGFLYWYDGVNPHITKASVLK